MALHVRKSAATFDNNNDLAVADVWRFVDALEHAISEIKSRHLHPFTVFLFALFRFLSLVIQNSYGTINRTINRIIQQIQLAKFPIVLYKKALHFSSSPPDGTPSSSVSISLQQV